MTHVNHLRPDRPFLFPCLEYFYACEGKGYTGIWISPDSFFPGDQLGSLKGGSSGSLLLLLELESSPNGLGAKPCIFRMVCFHLGIFLDKEGKSSLSSELSLIIPISLTTVFGVFHKDGSRFKNFTHHVVSSQLNHHNQRNIQIPHTVISMVPRK